MTTALLPPIGRNTGIRPLIAILDSTHDLLALYGEAMTEAGYDVFLARVPPDLDVLSALSPAALLLDLQLGVDRADGLAYLTRIRDDPRLAWMQVIVCTGASHLVRACQATLQGWGVPVIAKPFDLDHLLEVVARATASRQRQGACDVISA
jgi:DNA-binding NtrC family response regulator